ncbi:MAG: hypothetical protein V3U28_02910 [Candidatus Acidoferrales bacterium]
MMEKRFLFWRSFLALSFAVVLPLLVPPGLGAQTTPEKTEARLKALEERLRELEAELKELKAAQPAAGTPTAPTPQQPTGRPVTTVAAPVGVPQGPTGQLPVYGGASALAKILNPDIGIIGQFTGAVGRNRVNPVPALSLQESEVSLRAIVDPFARADFFLAIGEEGIEVEEGYLTFPALPGGFLLKVGKMRAAFGRQNQWHNHSLPWVDRPLVAFSLLGGELDEPDTGIKDAGFSLSRLLPAPGGIFLEATAEIFRGDSGTLFQSSRRSDVAVVSHLRSFSDLSESTNLEVGGSYARGHNDSGLELGGDFVTRVFGFDATLRWKPLRGTRYRSFILRTELTWSRRQDPLATQRAFGYFTSADYQLSRRWFAGGRYDWSERGANADQHDSGGSVILTFWPSEFNAIQGQLRRTRFAEGETANEFLFRFVYVLGAHGAHPF